MSLSELRPLSMGEILDGAFALYRRHLGVMAGTALLAYAPAMVMWAWFAALGGSAAGVTALGWLNVGLQAVAAVVCAGALTQQANAAYRGGEVSVAAGLGMVRERFWPVAGALLLRLMMLAVGYLLLVVPGVVFEIKFFAMVPAVVVEGETPSAAATRSSDLTEGAWGRVLALIVVLYVLMWLPSTAASYAADAGVALLRMGGGASMAVSQVAGLVAQALAAPVGSLAVLLLYYDRRVRAEALDLDAAAAALA